MWLPVRQSVAAPGILTVTIQAHGGVCSTGLSATTAIFDPPAAVPPGTRLTLRVSYSGANQPVAVVTVANTEARP